MRAWLGRGLQDLNCLSLPLSTSKCLQGLRTKPELLGHHSPLDVAPHTPQNLSPQAFCREQWTVSQQNNTEFNQPTYKGSFLLQWTANC